MFNCLKSIGREKAPITTRIAVGTKVHVISNIEWWVKFDGSGFDFLLNFKMTIANKTIMNKEIKVIITNKKLSNQRISLASSVTAGWKLIPPCSGFPITSKSLKLSNENETKGIKNKKIEIKYNKINIKKKYI